MSDVASMRRLSHQFTSISTLVCATETHTAQIIQEMIQMDTHATIAHVLETKTNNRIIFSTECAQNVMVTALIVSWRLVSVRNASQVIIQSTRTARNAINVIQIVILNIVLIMKMKRTISTEDHAQNVDQTQVETKHIMLLETNTVFECQQAVLRLNQILDVQNVKKDISLFHIIIMALRISIIKLLESDLVCVSHIRKLVQRIIEQIQVA